MSHQIDVRVAPDTNVPAGAPLRGGGGVRQVPALKIVTPGDFIEDKDQAMSVITLRLPDDQHGRLKDMAKVQGISLNKLFEQLTARILTENDLELRYRRLAASGSPERGLELLDRIEKPAETAPHAP